MLTNIRNFELIFFHTFQFLLLLEIAARTMEAFLKGRIYSMNPHIIDKSS